MKKASLYIIITVLLMIISSGGTYIVLNNKIIQNNNNINKDSQETLNEDKDNNTNKDGVKLVATKNNNENITESFEITLNNKKKIFNISFAYELDNTSEIPAHILKGTYIEKELYYSLVNKNVSKSEYFNISNIREYFNENNFLIIKGEDKKNYLAIIVNNYPDTLMYLFNDNLELITDISLKKNNYNTFIITKFYNSVVSVENNKNIWYSNNYNLQFTEDVKPSNTNLKIENNTIYYLVANDNNEVEERKYTINNNELKYEIINKYPIKELGNVTI